MKGLIIMKKVGMWVYTNESGDLIQNRIAEKLEKKGVKVIHNFDMRKCYLYDGKILTENNDNLCELDAFYHMNADEQTPFQTDLLKILSLSGVKVFNGYNEFMMAQDKMATNFLLRKAGLNVPPAMLIGPGFDKERISKIIDEWGSILVKPRRNHCGVGIMKFDSFEAFYDFYLATDCFYTDYYIEKYIDFGDNDFRVEVFDGKAIGGYSRQKRHSFKSNVGSGGKMLDIPVQEEHKEIAIKAAKTIGITTTIVDMIRSKEDDKIYILEVNPIMGIFVEAGMRSGDRMPVYEKLPEQFCYDEKKIDLIVDYFERLIQE